MSGQSQCLPPSGYPSSDQNPQPKGENSVQPPPKKKGDRGFIEGCLFDLCCCWLDCHGCCE